MKYKVLAASALIGLLVVAASGGTTLAALSDMEESENNFFHIGAVDFRIGWNLSRNNVSSEDQIPIDDPYRLFDERNITPGDHGEATIGIYNQDNPAYIQFKANQTGNSENGIIETEGSHETTICNRVLGYQQGDSFKADRSGGQEISYAVEDKKGSYIGLEAPEQDRLGENGSENTDSFEFELDGKPETLRFEIESGDETAYITLEEGESREVFSGALEAEVVDIERVSKDRYRVQIEVTSDSDSENQNLTGLNVDFCDQLSYYQFDFVEGDVINELGEQGLYGDRKILAVHGNTMEIASGEGGSTECVDVNGYSSAPDGDRMQLDFTVKDSCNEKLTLASYKKSSGGGFDLDTVDQQILLDYTTEEYGPGSYTREVRLKDTSGTESECRLNSASMEYDQNPLNAKDFTRGYLDVTNNGNASDVRVSFYTDGALTETRKKNLENGETGEYEVSLSAGDDRNKDGEIDIVAVAETDCGEQQLAVDSLPVDYSYDGPVARANVTPLNPEPGEEVEFKAEEMEGVERIEWSIADSPQDETNFDFNDEIESSERKVTTEFEEEGYYPYILRIYREDGTNNPFSSTIKVKKSEDKDIDNTEDEGELGQALRFTLWYDDGDNILEEDESVIYNSTAHQLDQSDIGDGLLLDSNLSEPGTQRVGNEPLYMGFKWHLPENTKCNVQTDSKKFDFEFSAKQERHNEFQLIDTENFLGDQENIEDNYFEAGKFSECEQEKEVCGNIQGLEDGTDYIASRTDGDTETAEYDVVRDSESSVKFEGPDSNLLGEDGEMESDTFSINVEGETDDTVYVETKAGKFNGTAMLQGEGDTVMDTSGLWRLELVDIQENGDTTQFKVKITSDSEEGSHSPALSYIEFSFCEPIEKEGYYQLDFNEGDTHEPEAGETHPDLFMAAVSSRDDGGTRLNPSLLSDTRKPENLELHEEKFIIEERTASVRFNVTSEPINLSVSSHEMPGPYSGWQDSDQDLQVLFDNVTKRFEPGNHEVTVDLPTGKYPEPGEKFSSEDLSYSTSEDNDTDESGTDDSGTNESEQVENQLVSHWKMNGLMREVNDSQKVQHGENNGARRGKTGKKGNAFEFHGDDSVDVKNVPEYETENGTVMMWFKMEDEGTSWLYSKDRDGCTLDCGHLSIAHNSNYMSTDGLGVRLQNDGGGENDVELSADSSKKEINSGEWHHVAVSFGTEGTKMYVDGELHDSSSNTKGISGNQLKTVLGQRYDKESGTGLEGKLDDVRFYNFQVSEQNITEIVENSSEIHQISAEELLDRKDKSYSFNGTQKEDISHSSEFELEEGTFSLRFKMNNEDKNWVLTKDEKWCSGNCGHLSMAYGSDFINTDGFGVRLQSDGGDGDVILEPETEVKAGEWNNVTFSFGQNGTRLYMNSELEDSSTETPGMTENQLPIVVGQRYDGASGTGLNGTVENLRLFNDQLSDEEIIEINSANTVISTEGS